MAVKPYRDTATKYVGTFDEMATSNRDTGSEYYCTDTGNTYKCDGDNWIPKHILNDASAFEQITIDSTVGGKALTSTTYTTARKALITVETAQIRFTVNGTAPTTTVGHIGDIGDTIELESNADIVAFRAIRTGGTSGLISVTYSN